MKGDDAHESNGGGRGGARQEEEGHRHRHQVDQDHHKLRSKSKLIPNNAHLLTSGALTFVVLAAALVTASFLMSPVIEDVFGRQHMRNYHQLIKMKQEEIFLPFQTLCFSDLNLHLYFAQSNNPFNKEPRDENPSDNVQLYFPLLLAVHRKMDHTGAYASNHTGNSSR